MRTATAKQDRIGARVPHEVYEMLCRAAELTGATVNQFLVQSALEGSPGRHRAGGGHPPVAPRLELAARPAGKSAAPNARLQAALERYQKAQRDDAGTAFNWEP